MANLSYLIYYTRGAKHFFRPENSFHKYGAGCMQTHLQKFAHVVEKAVWKNFQNCEKSWKIPKINQKWRKQANVKPKGAHDKE